MKCEKCKLEWQSTGVEQVLFCPFCNSSLVILEENFQYLEDVFSYLTKEYGLEILRNKRSTLQFMKCFFLMGSVNIDSQICFIHRGTWILFLELGTYQRLYRMVL